MSSLGQAQIPPHRYIRILQSHSCRSHFHRDCPRNTHRYLQVAGGGDKVRGETVGSDSDTTSCSVLVRGSALSSLVLHFYTEGMCVPYNHRFRPGVCPCSTAETVRDLNAYSFCFPRGFLQPVLMKKCMFHRPQAL